MDKVTFEVALEQQPEAIVTTIGSVRRDIDSLPPIVRAPEAILTVCAMGASTHAAEALVAIARSAGRMVLNAPASVWSGPLPGDWALGISESGRSPEPAQALHGAHGPRVVLTNVPGSPLTALADATLDLGGVPDAGVYVTGYTGTLAALALLAERMGIPGAADGLDHSPAVISAVLEAARPEIEDLLSGRRGRSTIDAVGAGASFAAAAELALLAREAARLPSAAFDTDQYLHGPIESAGPDTLLVVLGEDPHDVAAALPDDVPVIRVTSGQASATTARRVSATRLDLHIGAPSVMTSAIGEGVVAQLVAGALSDGSFEVGTFRHEFSHTKVARTDGPRVPDAP